MFCNICESPSLITIPAGTPIWSDGEPLYGDLSLCASHITAAKFRKVARDTFNDATAAADLTEVLELAVRDASSAAEDAWRRFTKE